MALNAPQCAINMEQRLAALRHDQEIDGLRVYLIKYNLFPRNRDPENSPIRIEELKELVKHWKLHRQRGFWRDHPEKDDLVRALLQHIKSEAANKKRRQEAQEKYHRKHPLPVHDPIAPREMSAEAKHEFSMILGGGKEFVEQQGETTSFLTRKSGGDLFYTRGDYDEGMIYLSRIDKGRFQSNPREELRHAATPLIAEEVSPVRTEITPRVPTPNLNTTVVFTREMKLKCIEGLYNVSCHKGFEMQILREGAMNSILNVIKTEDTMIRLYAAATLLNLSAVGALPVSKASTMVTSREIVTRMMEDGVVSALLELAHTPHTSVKAYCAQTLFRLTAEETNHFRMVHEGVVATLSQLMTTPLTIQDSNGDGTNPVELVKHACMNALVNLAAIPRAVTCDAILTTLVKLEERAIAQNDTSVLDMCAQALLNLSILPTTRVNIVEDGVMTALTVLLQSPSIHHHEMVSCILCNLVAIKTNQELMTKNNVVTLLSQLFAVQTQEISILQHIRRNTAHIIAQLCCNSKLSLRIMNTDLIPKILELLKQRQETLENGVEDEEEMEKYCIISLSNLALDDRCRTAIVTYGAVPFLLSILHDQTLRPATNTTTLLQLDCVTALSHLMLHPKNFTRMVEEGVVPAMLRMIQHSENQEIQRACVYAMLTLAQDAGMKTKLAQVTSGSIGAIPTMLDFASKYFQHTELCSVCVSFLYHLSTRSDNYEILYQEGAIGLLVRVLQRPTQKESLANVYILWLDCMATLSHLATHSTLRTRFVEEGVIEAIQHILSVSNADLRPREKRLEIKWVRIQFAMSQILFKLQSACVEQQHGPFFSSLLLLATQSSAKNSRLDKHALQYQQKTVLRCALTVTTTTLSLRGLRLLSTHYEIPPALNMIMRTGVHQAQVCAAIALCNIAMESGSRLWRKTTIDDFIVITLLRLNSDQTKAICAKALFNLLTHESTRDQMVQDGVLYALLKLARLENEEIRDLALRSVYNLSLESIKATYLIEMEIVRIISKMYAFEFSKELKRLVCGILSNLSHLPSQAMLLIKEGALIPLKSLVKVRDPETKTYAANVLYNLSCDTSVSEMLVRDEANVLWLLMGLLKTENQEVRRYSAQTIANLSYNPIALQLMTDSGPPLMGGEEGVRESMVVILSDVIKRTMASCLITTSSCVFALRNLLTLLSNQQRFISCNGIPILASLLSCSEMDTTTLHVSTDLLCALANLEHADEGFELQVVKDGMVRALYAIAKGMMKETSMNKTIVMNIITSLSNLSKQESTHDGMLRDGGLETIALLAQNMNDPRTPYKGLVGVKGEEFCHHCAIVLRNLTHQHVEDVNGSLELKNQRLSSQPALIPILMALAQSTQIDTREHVVVTLHNLALYRRCRMQMLKHDGIKVLLRLGTNSHSPITRHLCSLTLQLLSKADQDEDPHSANIAQEGLVAAISALAEHAHHSHDMLLAARESLHQVVIPRTSTTVPKPAKNAQEAVLLPTKNESVVQQGAPPDWAKVALSSLGESWPELQTLATALHAGTDDTEEGQDEDSENEEGDSEQVVTRDRSDTITNAGTLANGVTAPRTCSADIVLGNHHILEDTKLDKVKLNIEAEMALTTILPRKVGKNEELPPLRPSSAPENEEQIVIESPLKSPTKVSTLVAVRHDSTPSSPIKSPTNSTLRRKSQTRGLEPLTVGFTLGSSASTPHF